jgi:hypothetical protein
VHVALHSLHQLSGTPSAPDDRGNL